jgi:hypothetical protein
VRINARRIIRDDKDAEDHRYANVGFCSASQGPAHRWRVVEEVLHVAPAAGGIEVLVNAQ